MPAVRSVPRTDLAWKAYCNLNISKTILCIIQAYNSIPRALNPFLFNKVQPNPDTVHTYPTSDDPLIGSGSLEKEC
jgi:hypothetical protein